MAEGEGWKREEAAKPCLMHNGTLGHKADIDEYDEREP